jgi:signal transduction histidine kinase
MAPWGVAIQDPEEEVFAPSRQIQKTFMVLGILFILTALILAIGISRSVVNPIGELINATNRIASGDMSRPVMIKGSDEIGILSNSFETMRQRLAESLEKIRNHNIELETRIKERTREIKESRKMIENLLKKIITTQEEERRRIARELHDDTMQNLSAILMNIDMCMLYPENISRHKIEGVREIAVRTLDGVQGIIQNLRPTILDDLGLEAAIRWLLDTHLNDKNITYFLDITGVDGTRFEPEIESNLFRIIQESIINISKHSGADNVIINMDVSERGISVLIEDDGDGFDLESILQSTRYYKRDGRGLGLLGMRERAGLIGGKLLFCTEPGNGTRITLEVPLKGEDNGEDKSLDS